MVIYWGAHYYAFFRVFIDGEEEWLRVDDRTITKKGAWKDIVRESVDAMVTPTIILFEKYKESVLVPKVDKMEANFKLDKRFLRDLISETSKSKKRANYKDCRIDFVQQESTPVENAAENGFKEAVDTEVEKREEHKGGKQENKLEDYKEEGKEEEKEEDEDKHMDEGPQSPPIGEDEWICDYCQQINPNDDSRCQKCRKRNEIIDELNRAKRLTNLYKKECYKCKKTFDGYNFDKCPECYRESRSK